jgi:hypothetical protein
MMARRENTPIAARIEARTVRGYPAETVEGETVDITALLTAVALMQNAWRDHREVFSVEVMRAFGDVIREAEADRLAPLFEAES